MTILKLILNCITVEDKTLRVCRKRSMAINCRIRGSL